MEKKKKKKKRDATIATTAAFFLLPSRENSMWSEIITKVVPPHLDLLAGWVFSAPVSSKNDSAAMPRFNYLCCKANDHLPILSGWGRFFFLSFFLSFLL